MNAFSFGAPPANDGGAPVFGGGAVAAPGSGFFFDSSSPSFGVAAANAATFGADAPPPDAAPAAEPAKADATAPFPNSPSDFVTVHVTDESGAMRAVTIALAAVPRVPYLETMMTTGVGTQQDDGARQISLPYGCTVSAAAALLLRVALVTDSAGAPYITDASCGTMDAAIELLRTADFLMMSDAIPAIVHQCHRNLGRPEDLAKLVSIESASVEVQQMRQALNGSALVNAMSHGQVGAMVKGMRESASISAGQAAALVGWLSVGVRTTLDTTNTLLTTIDLRRGVFSSLLWKTNGRNSAGKVVLVLKDGAEALLQKLGRIAASRPNLCLSMEAHVSPTARAARGLIEDLLGPAAVPALNSLVLKPVKERQFSFGGGGTDARAPDVHYVYEEAALQKYLDAFVTPFHETTNDAQRGALMKDLLRSDTYLAASHGATCKHVNELIKRSEPYTLEAVQLVLPALLDGFAIAQAVSLLLNSEKEAHPYAVEMFVQRSARVSKHITMASLSNLDADLQVKLVAALMAHLSPTDANAVLPEVREYIEEALASGAM